MLLGTVSLNAIIADGVEDGVVRDGGLAGAVRRRKIGPQVRRAQRVHELRRVEIAGHGGETEIKAVRSDGLADDARRGHPAFGGNGKGLVMVVGIACRQKNTVFVCNKIGGLAAWKPLSLGQARINNLSRKNTNRSLGPLQ